MNVHRSSSSSFSNLKLGLIRRFTLNVSDHQKQNHYDRLGVTPKATQGDIKTAYYKLSKEYHPDLNKGDESAAEKFRHISAAYEVLGNVKSRKVYDRGLLVGSYSHEYEGETDPAPDNYPHASFYHHRNKPASRKSETSHTTHYNIDEWTRAHYSKTFNKKNEWKYKDYKSKEESTDSDKHIARTLPTLSLVVLVTVFFLTYGTDANRNFDSPSKIKYKPD